jgi:heat shock protein HtpX
MASPLDPLHVLAWWIAVPLALVPAALNWWWRRALDRDSATALPERHLAIAQRIASISFVCCIAIGLFAGWPRTLWILALQFVALACTTYQTRRRLFGETWTLPRYLVWRIQILVAFIGFWWFIACAPAFVANTSPLRWWLAGGMLVLALAWHHWNSRIALSVLRATPLTRPDLDDLFERILSRARIPPPPVWRAGVSGGVFANALALPSIAQPRVLFFDTLLERLAPREIAAILAHEVAHLEHFSGRRMITLYGAAVALLSILILGAAAIGPLAPELASWMPLASFFMVFGGLWLRARRMQPKETEADLRAIELCGDPDALVSGLKRLHEINHVPRRWSARMEEQATHPSLARRIRAIREHSTSPAPAVAIERTLIRSSDPRRLAFVDRDRVGFLWYEGDAPHGGEDVFARARRSETTPYTELKELRVAAGSRGDLTLSAIDRRSRRWSMPIDERDAAHAQAALDLVDHLIPPRSPDASTLLHRVLPMAMLIGATLVGALAAVLLPALLAIRRPSRRLMTTLAAALTVAALLKWTEPEADWAKMIVIAMFGAVTLWMARRAQPVEPESSVWQWVERIALLLPAAAGLTVSIANAGHLFDLHASMRDHPWLGSAGVALAAFLSLSPRRSSRRLGPVVAVLAIVALLIGSPVFLLAVVRDPLAADMPSLTEQRVSVSMTARRSVDGDFTYVWVTPDARAFLLAAEEEERDDDDALPPPRRYLTGEFDGETRTFTATEASLVGDGRLLVLDRERGTTRLHADEARTGRVLWTRLLPVDASLMQVAPSGRWRVLARRRNRFTRIEGRIGSDDVTETAWTIEAAHRAYVAFPRVSEGDVALAVASIFDRRSIPWLGMDWRQTTQLLRARPDGTQEIATSRLDLDCLTSPVGSDGHVCVSFDGRWSRFWRFDSRVERPVAAGQIRHAFWRVRHDAVARLTARLDVDLAVIDLGSGTIRRMTTPRDNCWITDFAAASDRLVAICNQGGSTNVSQYRTLESARIGFNPLAISHDDHPAVP